MPSVLVVDDDLGTCDGFAKILRLAGFEVAAVATGHDGLELAQRRSFDVILVDLRLPDMSGLDVLRTLRAQRREVPLVMMTAFGSVATAVQALGFGALDYVEKPIDNDDLVDVVRRAADAGVLQPTGHAPNVLSLQLPRAHADARVSRALQIIERRYPESDLSVAAIAQEFGLSTAHFCRLFKRETGCGFGTHLHRYRILQAQLRLRDTTLSIKETAFRVGYETRQLDRHFLKLCGMTPLAYRRSVWRDKTRELPQQ